MDPNKANWDVVERASGEIAVELAKMTDTTMDDMIAPFAGRVIRQFISKMLGKQGPEAVDQATRVDVEYQPHTMLEAAGILPIDIPPALWPFIWSLGKAGLQAVLDWWLGRQSVTSIESDGSSEE